MNKSCFFILLFLSYSLLYSQNVHHTRERTYDVLHYKLNIEIDEKAKTCTGDVIIKFLPLRPEFEMLQLDAAKMSISTVKMRNKTLEFFHVGETLTVAMDKPYSFLDTLDVVVSYSVTSPKKGLYFIQPDSGYPDKQWQVWSQGESEDNHHWFPCYDSPNDMATSEMVVTVKDNFTAISNGKLLGVKRHPKKKLATYHWLESKPHVSYLISLVVGEYVEVKDSWGVIPLSYYVYKHQRSDAMRSFTKTPKMMEFFSTKIEIQYPWEKYAQTVVQDFIYGGMENVSATTLTDNTIHDARAHLDYNSDGLVAHELAHQWWGNLLSFRDWSHAWLSEGFASYFDILFQEYDKGSDVAMKMILDAQTTLANLDVGENRRPTVTNRYVTSLDLFDNRIYGKGACILHMLRFMLGDELFWKSVKHYAQKFALKNVETNDFKIAIEEATGYNLHWFFDQWVYKAGRPEFDITSSWDQSNRNVKIFVKQVQKTDSLTGIFTTPVDIEVWMNHVPETYRVTITKAEEEFTFPAYQQPQLVIFDKGSHILKKANFPKSSDEWIYQLHHAKNGVDRLLAIEELRWMVDSPKVTKALNEAMLEDPFVEIRADAAWALADGKRVDIADLLMSAYGDREAKVRGAAVTGLGNFGGESVLKILRHAFESDSSYAVIAGALRSLAKVDSMNRKSYCSEALQRDSRNEIIRSAAIQILGQIGDDDALALVKSYTRYGIERNIRIQCVNTLASNWQKREDVLEHLIGMLNDASFHVRRAVIGALGNLKNPKALDALHASAEKEPDSRLQKEAREAIAKIEKAQQEQSR
ncbi:MAG: HEAT repeat domain-containing protein [Ignavibacteriae bacterium]|nr:HEAT repeat domain-containing protein [Ignavibacteriota bacterium]